MLPLGAAPLRDLDGVGTYAPAMSAPRCRRKRIARLSRPSPFCTPC